MNFFRKIPTLLFPVSPENRGRFACKLLLFFLISFVYNLLRTLKVPMVVSAPGSGADVIPFLKVWAILPGALGFTYVFARLQRCLNREQVFYAMVGIFMAFFVLFLTVLFPYRNELVLDGVAASLEAWLPRGAHGFVLMIRYWHYSLFYLFAELWGSVVLTMLFWGFVNEITVVADAKKFYGLFAFGSNSAPIAAGRIWLGLYSGDWDETVRLLLCLVLCVCVVIALLFYYLHRNHMAVEHVRPLAGKAGRPRFTLRQCFRLVGESRHLTYVALIVFGYNFVFNLTDVLWTHQLKLRFIDDSGALNAYIAKVTICNGLLATVVSLFITSRMIRSLGWLPTALATPTLILVTSVLFLPMMIFNAEGGMLSELAMVWFATPLLTLTVFVGSLQNCTTRAFKYTLFDATKEIAFIPLSRLEQRQGKAAIDGIGSRLGKSGGSATLQALLLLFSSLSAAIPVISVLIFAVSAAWWGAVYRLSHLLKKARVDDE